MSNQQQQHHNQQRDQRQQQPAPRPAFDGTTYYLVPYEDPDREMAREYLAKQGIEHTNTTRIVVELDVGRLTDRHRVIALYRNINKDRNKVRVVEGEDGKEHRQVYTAHSDILEIEPILCAKYWTPGDAETFTEGGLSVSGFLQELSRKIIPAVVSYHPDRGEPLRIRYA